MMNNGKESEPEKYRMEYNEKKITLNDGTEVLIRELTPEDYDQSLQFFKELPESDRQYLRVDVTDPEVVKKRLQPTPLENSFRIAAVVDGRIIGDGVIMWPKFGWMSHVGELRAMVDRNFRRKGLASALFRELFVLGIKQGLKKLEARMLPEQKSTINCVEKIGFTQEGILPGCAMDSKGVIHDIVIMSSIL
jgi:L-amino acid N-acyltransferase YncA